MGSGGVGAVTLRRHWQCARVSSPGRTEPTLPASTDWRLDLGEKLLLLCLLYGSFFTLNAGNL